MQMNRNSVVSAAGSGFLRAICSVPQLIRNAFCDMRCRWPRTRSESDFPIDHTRS